MLNTSHENPANFFDSISIGRLAGGTSKPETRDCEMRQYLSRMGLELMLIIGLFICVPLPNYIIFVINLIFIFVWFSGFGRGLPVSPAVSTRTPLSRNVPSRSTFHSGQTRTRNHTGGYGPTGGLQTQDTSAIAHGARTSFFSKLSSKFSKR